MGNLFVVGFDEPNQAEGVHFKLQKLQSEGLVDLADVAVAVKDETGKAKLHHAGNLLAEGAAFPSFCGSLANLIFLNANGRCCFWRTRRRGNHRSIHERIGHSADS
jgi:uncharacterized membrane protein